MRSGPSYKLNGRTQCALARLEFATVVLRATLRSLLRVLLAVIVKASSGPRYVVGCRNQASSDRCANSVVLLGVNGNARVLCARQYACNMRGRQSHAHLPRVGSQIDKEKLTQGTRVTLDMTTLTIMRALPREVRGILPDCACARLRLAERMHVVCLALRS